MANADQTEEIPSILSCIEFLLEIHGLLVLRHVAAEILLFSDFDEDDMISSRDLKEVVDRLTGEQTLSDEDMQQLIDNVSYREETSIGIENLQGNVCTEKIFILVIQISTMFWTAVTLHSINGVENRNLHIFLIGFDKCCSHKC